MSDEEKYPNRWSGFGRVYAPSPEKDYSVVGTYEVPRVTDAKTYLDEWHNKGYTGNYVPKSLRDADNYPEDWDEEEFDDGLEAGEEVKVGPPENVSETFVFDCRGEPIEDPSITQPTPPHHRSWKEVKEEMAQNKAKEELHTDPETGGMKGRKECELAFVDPMALEVLGRVAGKGTRKYDKYNYLRGYDWSLSANALQRHYLAFWQGEDVDPESGELHVAHMAWHALALVSFMMRGLGTDDRPHGE